MRASLEPTGTSHASRAGVRPSCLESNVEPSARQAQEAAGACEGLLPDQEQALPRRERSGRHGAQVRLRRPPPQEARLPAPVGRPHQRRGARARPHLRPAHQRPEGRRRRARSQDAGRPGGRRSPRRSPPWPRKAKAAREPAPRGLGAATRERPAARPPRRGDGHGGRPSCPVRPPPCCRGPHDRRRRAIARLRDAVRRRARRPPRRTATCRPSATGSWAARAARHRALIAELGQRPAGDEARLGRLANELKRVDRRSRSPRAARRSTRRRRPAGAVDVTLPGRPPAPRPPPSAHASCASAIEAIFARMGYEILDGPETEDD